MSALLDHAGVIQVDRLEELIDVSSVLLASGLPNGSRVAIVGNSGGPLILAADACVSAGLEAVEFCSATQSQLATIAGPRGAVSNPVDLTAEGTAADLVQVIKTVVSDDEVDAVIVVVMPLPALSAGQARAGLSAVSRDAAKPVVLCLLGDDVRSDMAGDEPYAEFSAPERAVGALGRVCRYAKWRRRPRRVQVGNEPEEAPIVDHATVASALARYPEGAWLDLDEAATLLARCGLPVVPTLAAASASEAVRIAHEVGFPVVLKACSGDLLHKTEAGGVVVGLENPSQLRDAFETMSRQLGPQMGGAVLQPVVAGGVEAIIGVTAHPRFGPVVMVGLGGVLTDLLADRAFAIPPLDPGEAERMVASLRAAPLLDGYRGSPAVDRAALVRLIELVAHVADQFPELAELDLNPVIVRASGALVVDCKARLVNDRPGPGAMFRSLRQREYLHS